MNKMKNCPVKPEHVDLAFKIFGQDVSTLKGKSTRPNPGRVETDMIFDLPSELLGNNQRLELCMDVMHVNGVPFLLSIDRRIKYRSVVALDDMEAGTLLAAIQKIVNEYKLASFKITTVHLDDQFATIKDTVEEKLRIKINLALPDAHVPEAERNIRTVKNRIRVAYNRQV